MRRLLFLYWLTLGIACAEPAVRLQLSPQPVARELARYGLNLGTQSAWGAEQLLANILANPGFEAVLEGSLVQVGEAGSSSFVEADAQIERADGFWQGARAEILGGRLAGRQFIVAEHRQREVGQPARYRSDRSLDGLQRGDIVALQRISDSGPPARWWSGGRVSIQAGARPGSAGKQVVHLTALPGQPAHLASYIDTLPRAGRLLAVDGAWRLNFWLRRTSALPVNLRVRFARDGGEVFVDQQLAPGQDWQPIEIAFNGNEALEGKGHLDFSLSLQAGSIDIDDIYLGEARPGAGGFRQAVVETLRSLRPGFLRDWQGQLGDSADNRLANEEARQPVRYRPGEAEIFQTYSIPQTMALCAAVGASPWLILPTTLGKQDARRLGEAIARLAGQHRLPRVLVEFGNENWNPLFRAAGIPDPKQHAQLAGQALASLRAGFSAVAGRESRLLTVVNARQGDWGQLQSLRNALPAVDRLAVGNYFSYRLEAQSALPAALAAAFAQTGNAEQTAMQAWATRNGQTLAAYELNFHTTEGSAPASLRNALVQGPASGPALASRLLAGSLGGLQEQAVYALAGYDSFAQRGETVQLFGVVRDLKTTGNLRSTGWAIKMLNRVVGDDLHALNCNGNACPQLLGAAFVAGRSLRLALSNAQAQPVEVTLGEACRWPSASLEILDGSQAQTVTPPSRSVLTCRDGDWRFILPGYSLATLSDAPDASPALSSAAPSLRAAPRKIRESARSASN